MRNFKEEFVHIPSPDALRILACRKRYARSVFLKTVVRYCIIAIGCYAVVAGLCVLGS